MFAISISAIQKQRVLPEGNTARLTTLSAWDILKRFLDIWSLPSCFLVGGFMRIGADGTLCFLGWMSHVVWSSEELLRLCWEVAVLPLCIYSVKICAVFNGGDGGLSFARSNTTFRKWLHRRFFIRHHHWPRNRLNWWVQPPLSSLIFSWNQLTLSKYYEGGIGIAIYVATLVSLSDILAFSKSFGRHVAAFDEYHQQLGKLCVCRKMLGDGFYHLLEAQHIALKLITAHNLPPMDLGLQSMWLHW